MRHISNPLLPVDQPSTHVAAVELAVKVSVDRRVSLAGSTVDEADKTVAEVLIVVETFDRRLHTLGTSQPDVVVLA